MTAKNLQQDVCLTDELNEKESLKARVYILAPRVVFGNHVGDSLPSVMFGVLHRAHARAGSTKIEGLLRILGGGWLVVVP